MIRFGPWLIALSVVAPASLLAPGAAQAQAPGQGGFSNKSDFRDYDSFLFNYRSPSSPGTPLPLRPSPDVPRLSPLGPTGAPRPGLAQAGMTSSLAPGSDAPPGQAGRLLLSWLYQTETESYRAVAMAADGKVYHWVYFLPVKDFAYLYDPLRAGYIGIFDFPARLYRPYEAATGRWGAAMPPPVPAPSAPPIAPPAHAARVPVRQSPSSGPGPRPSAGARPSAAGAGPS
jgi:hypothetical protein